MCSRDFGTYADHTKCNHFGVALKVRLIFRCHKLVLQNSLKICLNIVGKSGMSHLYMISQIYHEQCANRQDVGMFHVASIRNLL